MLTELSGSRAAPAREVERAKALATGVPVGLKDTFHRPKEPEILADAKAWVVSLACTKLKDHGLAAELWTLSALMRSPACKRSA
jgi:hypothetical protein